MKATLEGLHLVVVERKDFSDTVAKGRVIGTEPAAGQPVLPNATVTVVVSKGPDVVTVPDVRHESVDAATSELQGMGLKVDVQNFGPGKKVRAQDPGGGSVVPRGTTVTLFL